MVFGAESRKSFRKQDAAMFALYLAIIGIGAVMAGQAWLFGLIQVVVGSTLFGLRLWLVFGHSE
jgi:hypothetical protein